MKRYAFELTAHQVTDFFTPIRNKTDIIRLLMKSIKTMLVLPPTEPQLGRNELVLVVAKMSRLFYFSEDKYFSITFPFTALETDGHLDFTSNTVSYIDSRTTSDVLAVLKQEENFNSTCPYQFVEPVLDIVNHEKAFWPFLLSLFMYEDGYIRYDYDEQRANADSHPLNHYDVFYSSNSTCKVGLRDRIVNDIMVDFLSTESNCHYLEQLPT